MKPKGSEHFRSGQGIFRQAISADRERGEMKAVVLAGGRARGFWPLARQCPKALLPVANTPLLAHTLRYLASQGVREAFVCVNAGDPSIRERFHDGRAFGLKLHFAAEPIPLGTAGCLRELRSSLDDGPFVVVAGLPFLDFPLADLIAIHRRGRATISVAVVEEPSPRGFAEEIVLGKDGQLEEILVPCGPAETARPRSLGVYILEPRIFDCIGSESYLDLKEQLIGRVRRAGLRVVPVRIPGVGVRLDTMADYLRICSEFISDGYMGWNRGDRLDRLVRLGEDVMVSGSAELLGPLLVGDRSAVAARAQVKGPTTIGAACRIQPASTVVASVLMEGAEVSEGASLERCLVAPSCRVPPDGNFADKLLLRPDNGGLGSVVVSLQAWPATRTTRTVAQQADSRTKKERAGRLLPAVKRLLDVCGASLGLLLTLPALAAAALAIELDSPGPILFRQRRAGQGGREFNMIKLRTMVADAEKLQESLADRNEIDGPMFKIGNDPRITRVGRFLRKTRIDELPQLLNVLRGDMSLVGPRPLAMKEMRYNPAWRDLRLQVKPGATGLWQVESNRKNSFQDWIVADIRYVEEQSLWLDIRILGRTVWEVWNTFWRREGEAALPKVSGANCSNSCF